MHSPSLSIIIPAYNSEKTLAEALDSIARQKDFNLSEGEILLIDDASTDGTTRVAEEWMRNHPEWAGRFQLLHNPGNLGPAASRNHGLRLASSEWIAFLDADDVWLPDKLAIQFRCAQNQPDVALWCGGVTGEELLVDSCQVDGNLRMKEKIGATERSSHIPNEQLNNLTTPPWVSDQEYPTSPLRHLTLTDFSYHNPVATSTVLAKRNAIIEVGGFDTSLRGPEDYDLWLRLAVKHRQSLIDLPLSYYRQTPGSLSMDDRTFLPQVIRVLKKAYGPGGALNHEFNQRVSLAWQMLMGAWMAGERKSFGRAWIWFMKALWQWPLPFPRAIPNKWPRLKLMKALMWRMGLSWYSRNSVNEV